MLLTLVLWAKLGRVISDYQWLVSCGQSTFAFGGGVVFCIFLFSAELHWICLHILHISSYFCMCVWGAGGRVVGGDGGRVRGGGVWVIIYWSQKERLDCVSEIRFLQSSGTELPIRYICKLNVFRWAIKKPTHTHTLLYTHTLFKSLKSHPGGVLENCRTVSHREWF